MACKVHGRSSDLLRPWVPNCRAPGLHAVRAHRNTVYGGWWRRPCSWQRVRFPRMDFHSMFCSRFKGILLTELSSVANHVLLPHPTVLMPLTWATAGMARPWQSFRTCLCASAMERASPANLPERGPSTLPRCRARSSSGRLGVLTQEGGVVPRCARCRRPHPLSTFRGHRRTRCGSRQCQIPTGTILGWTPSGCWTETHSAPTPSVILPWAWRS